MFTEDGYHNQIINYLDTMISGKYLFRTMFTLLAVTFILPSALSAQNSDEWEQLAPVPPPITLNALHLFDENKMVSVGHDGNMLWTFDGGETWDLQESVLGKTNILRAVNFYDENHGIAAGNTGGQDQPIFTTDGGNTWTLATSNVVGGIYDIEMINQDLAFATSTSGRVYRTTNGGQNWEQLDTGEDSSFAIFYTLHFFDENNGLVAGCQGFSSCNSSSLYKTSDGGDSWESVNSGVNVQLFDMQFLNDDVGYIGSRGRMLKSTDGGEEWTEINLPTTRWVRAIEFFSEDEGIAFASPQSPFSSNVQHSFFRTTDGGETWNEETITVPGIIEDIHSSGDIVWAVGRDGALLKSEDKGVTWEDPVITRQFISSIQNIDRETLIANTARQILLSSDSGITWSEISAPDEEPLIRYLHVFDAENLLISAPDGEMYNTSNGGETWTQFNNGTNSNFRDMVFHPEGTGIGVTLSNEVYISDDNGVTWSPIEGVSDDGVTDEFNSVAFNGESVFMIGGAYFWSNEWFPVTHISEDLGESWSSFGGVVENRAFNIQFADSKTVMMRGSNGSVAFSTDGAETWTRGDLPVSIINNIVFLDQGLAMVRSENDIYTTGNLGQDWELFEVIPSNDLTAFHIYDRLRMFGGGNSGAIYRTMNGFGFSDSEPASIEITSGNNQEFRVNEPSAPLQVTVRDAGGSPVRGGLVRFSIESVPEGSGNVGFESLQALSDENGIAEAVILAGDIPGEYTVTASSEGMNNSPLTFTLTVEESGVSDIVVVSGNGQVGFVNSTLESPLVVRTSNDEGDGIPQIPVNFEISSAPISGSGAGLTVTSAITDSNGEASTEVMLGIAPGDYVISVTSPEIEGVVTEFTVSAAMITSDEFTWELLNPSPQANGLFGIHAFDANTAVATGEFGTIMKTEDAGQTWDTEFLVTGEDITFHDVTFVGSNGWAVGQNGRIMKSTDSGDSWLPLDSGISNTLISVRFESSQNGWVTGGSGTLLKTTNGGETWEDISISTGNFVQSVYFTSEDVGFATVSTTTQNVVVSNPIYRTDDGGETWTGLTTENNYSVYDIQFLDEDHGWAASYRGIFRTNDGGETWDFTHVSNLNMRFFGIHIRDDQTGVAVDDLGRVWTTEDGSSWSVQYNEGGMRFWDLSFSDNNNGYVVGTNGEILVTNDGAESFEQLHSSFTTNTIRDIHFTSEANGYLVLGNSRIYYTDDAGDSWDSFNAGVNTGIGGSAGFSRVHFHGEDHGWAVTLNGDVLKKAGGSEWEEVEDVITTSSNRQLNALFVADDNTIFVGGGFAQTIQFKRSTDGGETWDDISSGLDPINDIFFLDANTGWATTRYLVFKTTDGGDNWDTASSFELSNDFSRIQFFDENTGYVLNSGNLLYTEDGGENWEQVEAETSITGNDFHFISPEKGWVAGSQIWSTEDGGETWVSNRKQSSSDLQAVFALSDENIWLGGENGLLLRSEDAILTSIDEEFISGSPMEYSLEQNYPNPFNPVTVIEFSLPQTSNVRLEVYNVIGQRVATLVNETRQAGVHQVNFNASNLASGVYFYRISAGSFVQTRQLTLIK